MIMADRRRSVLCARVRLEVISYLSERRTGVAIHDALHCTDRETSVRRSAVGREAWKVG
jgi:hypothetical protein